MYNTYKRAPKNSSAPDNANRFAAPPHSDALYGKTIWIAGAGGMVGSALIRRLSGIPGRIIATGKHHLDLRRQNDVDSFMAREKPDVVFLAAAKVGGIKANRDEPAEFLYDNLMIQTNVIHAAHTHHVKKLVFLGSSCIYPRNAAQPISEDALLSAPLEQSNEAYAIAKIAGLKLCAHYRKQYGHDFISAMPCNLYGINDYYDAERSHVIPAMIMKLHHAKINRKQYVTLWGSGTPLREFMFVDDLADALIFIAQHYSDAAPINIGSGQEISISDLATLLADIIGYNGMIIFDSAMPDGTPRKLLDSSRLSALGWHKSTMLRHGLELAYQDFCTRYNATENRLYASRA